MQCEHQGWGIIRRAALYAVLLIVALLRAASVVAAGVVGTGTPGSCTEVALDAALAGGGLVTFDCGPDPVTITITSTKVMDADTTIDGGSLITISGGNRVGVFSVNTGVTFTVENLTIANGRAPHGGGIRNDGTLMVTNSTFSGSNANRGGGIVNQGTLTVTNSTLAGNAGGVGAGIVNEPSGTLTASHGFARSPDSHDIPTVEWMPPILSPPSLGPLCVMIIPCTTGPGRISRSGRIRPNLGPGGPDSRGSNTL